MTPLQRYRNALAEHFIELTPAEAQLSRAACYYDCRQVFMKVGVRCPTDDDAFQLWLGDSSFAWAIDVQSKYIALRATNRD